MSAQYSGQHSMVTRLFILHYESNINYEVLSNLSLSVLLILLLKLISQRSQKAAMRQIELEHKHSKLSSLSYSLSSTKPCPVASNQAQDINVNVTQGSCYCSKHPCVGFKVIPKHLGTSTQLCPNYKYPTWTWICFIGAKLSPWVNILLNAHEGAWWKHMLFGGIQQIKHLVDAQRSKTIHFHVLWKKNSIFSK